MTASGSAISSPGTTCGRLRAGAAPRSRPRSRPGPTSSTYARAAASSATFAFCSTTSTVSPSSSFSSLTIRKSSWTMVGASPSDGSSSISSRGRADERAGEREHLLLAAAQRARLLVAAALQPGEVLEDARRLLAQRAPLAADVRAHAEVLPDGQLREEAAALGNVRDAGARDRVRLAARDRLAVEDDLAGLAHDSRDRAQRRRLAGAVGAEQRDDLAFLHRQRDAVQGLDRPVARLDVAQLKQRRIVRRPGRPRSPRDSPAPRRACPRRSCGRS